MHGTERGYTEANAALKGAGFKWSRNLGAWYLQPKDTVQIKVGKEVKGGWEAVVISR